MEDLVSHDDEDDENIVRWDVEEASVEQPATEDADNTYVPIHDVENCTNPPEDFTKSEYMSRGSAEEENEYSQIRVRVSSKHLTFASRVFTALLQPKFREGSSLRSGNITEVQLSEDHPVPVLILLNIIHGRLKKVPRNIDLYIFTEIAILVDKYELAEVTDIFLDFWVQNLEASIPRAFDYTLLPWICISWVFGIVDIFEQVTKIAQLESTSLVQEERLPIPESVLSMN